jgi:hypothetical protein
VAPIYCIILFHSLLLMNLNNEILLHTTVYHSVSFYFINPNKFSVKKRKEKNNQTKSLSALMPGVSKYNNRSAYGHITPINSFHVSQFKLFDVSFFLKSQKLLPLQNQNDVVRSRTAHGHFPMHYTSISHPQFIQINTNINSHNSNNAISILNHHHEPPHYQIRTSNHLLSIFFLNAPCARARF